MWMSKLALDLRSREARRDYGSPYQMHRTLLKAVEEAEREGKERLLFRVEPARGTSTPLVLVQTLTHPQWDRLPPRYALVFPPKPFHPTLVPGQPLHFRLRANPTKRLNDSGKRVALKTREDKLRWLRRRLEQGGFRLLSTKADGEVLLARILQDNYLEVPKKGHLLQVQAVLFEGLLQVVDPGTAVSTLKRGIGPGKALGLGLLSLHP